MAFRLVVHGMHPTWLPREPQIDGGGDGVAVGVVVGGGVAEGAAVPAPDDACCGVAGEARGAEVVGVQVVS